MLIRKAWYSVQGVLPDHRSVGAFYIDTNYVDHLKESGQIDKWRASPAIGDVLMAPTSIFQGLKRPDDPARFRDGLIYCGKPPQCYGLNGPEDPPEGFVLAVYIVYNPALGDYHAYDWDWKEEDPKEPGFPLSWRTDYGGLVWPANSPPSVT